MGENAMEDLDELASVTVSNDNEPQDDVWCSFYSKLINRILFIRQQQVIRLIQEKNGMLNIFYEGMDKSKNWQDISIELF